MSEKEKIYSQQPARRISIIGLKAQMLNGRTGTRVRYLTEGHGKGRFRVLLDGKHEPTEGNFWPKNMLVLDEAVSCFQIFCFRSLPSKYL